MKTITTILLEKQDDLLEKQQQIQQQEQETERDRLKRVASEFKALLESCVPHSQLVLCRRPCRMMRIKCGSRQTCSSRSSSKRRRR